MDLKKRKALLEEFLDSSAKRTKRTLIKSSPKIHHLVRRNRPIMIRHLFLISMFSLHWVKMKMKLPKLIFHSAVTSLLLQALLVET